MRLSEVRGDRVFDVIADIIDPVAELATSKEMEQLLERRETPKGVNPRTYALQRVRRLLPKLIKEHKGAFVGIMSAIDGVTPEEYLDGLTMASLFADVADLLNDDTFTDFFTSVAPTKAEPQQTSD